MLTDIEAETLEAYDQMADEWSRGHDTPRFWGPLFWIFQLFMPRGRLLEIGCGSGRDAETLMKMGYDWTGTDISSRMVALALKRHPGRRVLQMSVYNLPSFDESFDGFWAAAVLLHVPRWRLPEALASIREVVVSGGIGLITVKKGTGHRTVRQEIGDRGSPVTRHFEFYEDGELDPILEKAGFIPLFVGTFQREPTDVPWLAYVVLRTP